MSLGQDWVVPLRKDTQATGQMFVFLVAGIIFLMLYPKLYKLGDNDFVSSGLGLLLVAMIVEQIHGGTVLYAPRAPHGCQFHLELPTPSKAATEQPKRVIRDATEARRAEEP